MNVICAVAVVVVVVVIVFFCLHLYFCFLCLYVRFRYLIKKFAITWMANAVNSDFVFKLFRFLSWKGMKIVLQFNYSFEASFQTHFMNCPLHYLCGLRKLCLLWHPPSILNTSKMKKNSEPKKNNSTGTVNVSESNAQNRSKSFKFWTLIRQKYSFLISTNGRHKQYKSKKQKTKFKMSNTKKTQLTIRKKLMRTLNVLF